MDNYLRIDIRTKIIYFVLMLFFTILMMVAFVGITNIDGTKNNDVELDEGWNVQINGKTYSDVTLSDFKFGMCNKGDAVIMTYNIPEYNEISQPVLVLYSIHSMVTVRVDDEVIYDYGIKRFSDNMLLGYGRHFVTFPKDAAGRELTVEFNVSEDNAFEGIQPVTITDGNSYVLRDIGSKRIHLATAMFLMMFGIIIMLLSMIMIKQSVSFIQTFCIAMFSFLIGCWTLCNADLIEYMSSDLLVKSYMEYMSLYLLPLPFTYYLRDHADDKDTPRWIKIYFWMLIAAEIVFVISVFVLQLLNIVHLPNALSFAHGLMLLAILFFVIISIYDIRKRKKQINSVMIGFIVAIFLVMFEIFRFNLNKYLFGFTKNEYSSTTCFAVLIIVISMLIDYGNKISHVLYENAQQAVLEKLAYTDELTGLGNRRCYDEKLNQLEATSDPGHNYAIVSFDLNFLKKTNDTYGHEIGDMLLKSFADILKTVFDSKCTITRTGGDEFVVIIEDITEEIIKNKIRHMQTLMKEKNKESSKIFLDTSYGYAISDEHFTENELKADPQIISRIADDRMYEFKKISKLGRK